jgi:hypothetical protein
MISLECLIHSKLWAMTAGYSLECLIHSKLWAMANWSPWYSWNIAESGVKHKKSNKINQIILLTVLKVYDSGGE